VYLKREIAEKKIYTVAAIVGIFEMFFFLSLFVVVYFSVEISSYT